MADVRAVSPVTGELLASYPAADPDAVADAVARGRSAARTFGALPALRRLEHLARLRARMVERLDEIVATLVAATGKPPHEAMTSDLLASLEVVRWLEEHAAAVLAPEPRPSTALYPGSRFEVRLAPRGVVAVIAPWNYPLQLALVPAATALAAGNAVVLKPSEVTPTVGALIADLAADAGLPPDVLQVVQGDGRTGEALVRARPDLVFFTGSAATGRRIMAAAAEGLTPLVLELGGHDPMLVFADAPFERAVRGALWGAFSNAGQVCVSVGRCLVEAPLYERFVAAVARGAASLRVGRGPDAEIGALIGPRGRANVDAAIDDALARGARLATPRRAEGAYHHPVVLRDVTPSMRVMTDEVFGPVLPIMPFGTEDEAVDLANASAYGLNASVWTRDLERGRRVAGRLVTGSCAVNDVLKNIGNPHTPFGGEKASGFGRSHGPEGLRACCRAQALMVNPGALGREMNWFPYGRRLTAAVAAFIQLRHGRGAVAAGRRLARAARGLLGGES